MRTYKVIEVDDVDDLETELNNLENTQFILLFILHDELEKFVLISRSGTQFSIRQAEK